MKHLLFCGIFNLERIFKMNKNYYDILQVNRNASPEIIEKAYKTLAKKYHPDLQSDENKKHSEEILKEINEAYETLSTPHKKQLYDEMLLQEERDLAEKQRRLAQEEQDLTEKKRRSAQEKQNPQMSEEEFYLKQQQEIQRQKQLQFEQELAYQQQIQRAREQAYHDAYIQDLKNRGYRIRYKKSLKDYIKSFIALVLTILVLCAIWQIPFVHNYFADLYNTNPIIHSLGDIILNIFKKHN